jgi:acyl carrier protein
MTDEELNSLTAEVIRVIAETQRIPIETVSIDSTFEELKIDSLDGINIVFALENAFRIEIPDEAMNTMRSIRDVVAGVSRLLSQAPVQPGEP